MRVLLTGFGPFLDVKENPSASVVRGLAHLPGVHAAVLPVSYRAASTTLPRLLEAHRPDAVLSFGISNRATSLLLERFFLNITDGPPDVSGQSRSGKPIDTSGPLALASTLPLKAMHRSLKAAGIPVAFSNHAGAYLCNYVGYRFALAASHAKYPFLSGFIHLPPVQHLPLDTQIAAAKRLLHSLDRKSFPRD